MNPNRIINFLIALFLLIYPWGKWIELNLFNIETNRGLSTLLIILIVIFGILNGNFTRGLKYYNKIQYLFLFIVMCTLGTLISGQLDSSFTIVSFITYFILIFVVLGLNLSLTQISNFVKILFYSTFTMLLISILDYHSIINFVGMNNSNFNSYDQNIGWVYDLTVPFNSRSHFANHLSLVVLLPVVYLASEKSYFSIKSFFNIIAIIMINYAAILNHSRSLFVSIFLTLIFYLFINRDFKALRIVAAIILVFLIGVNFYSDSFEAIFSRFSNFDISSDNDGLRYMSFLETLNSLIHNPIGYGFSRPYNEFIKDFKDVHSNITYIFRAGVSSDLYAF